MDLEGLAKRIQVLEDIEAIKRLRARYSLHIDSGEWDEVADLFTRDAVWEGGPVGHYEGQDAIRTFMRAIPELVSFALHYVTNPLIEVNGDEATGHWYLLEPSTMAKNNEAAWGISMYHDRYVRENDQWKFAEVRLRVVFWTPYEKGWAKQESVFA